MESDIVLRLTINIKVEAMVLQFHCPIGIIVLSQMAYDGFLTVDIKTTLISKLHFLKNYSFWKIPRNDKYHHRVYYFEHEDNDPSTSTQPR